MQTQEETSETRRRKRSCREFRSYIQSELMLVVLTTIKAEVPANSNTENIQRMSASRESQDILTIQTTILTFPNGMDANSIMTKSFQNSQAPSQRSF